MWIFELTTDIVGLGRKGDRVVVDDRAQWPQALVHPMPFNPGRLLLHLTEGDLNPLSPDGEAALVRLTSAAPPPPPGTRARQRPRRQA